MIYKRVRSVDKQEATRAHEAKPLICSYQRPGTLFQVDRVNGQSRAEEAVQLRRGFRGSLGCSLVEGLGFGG